MRITCSFELVPGINQKKNNNKCHIGTNNYLIIIFISQHKAQMKQNCLLKNKTTAELVCVMFLIATPF